MTQRTNVPLDSIQPDADELIGYRDLAAHLETLRSNPRVLVSSPGRSHEGRDIFLVTISSPQNIKSLQGSRSRMVEVSARREGMKSLRETNHEGGEASSLPEGLVPAVLLMGLSFGHEAAHVEALVRVIDQLASSHEDGILDILSETVVLVMPMVNPDGRMRAIEEWRRYPLSTGCNGAGNAFGFLLNRDFLHQIHPESQAVMKVFHEWEPIVCLDLHEDKVILAVERPEVCWVPPYSDKPYPQTLRPSIMECVDDLGATIAKTWREAGFEPMFDPEGQDSLMPIASRVGFVDCAAVMHNTIALITESARAPGSQTWADRIKQKHLACIALLRRVVGRKAEYTQVVTRARTSLPDRSKFPVYVVPKEKGDPCGVYRLALTLYRNKVDYYNIESPYPAYVVPSRQPKHEVIRTFFGDMGEDKQILLGDFGAVGFSLDKLPAAEQEAIRSADLLNGHEPPIPRLSILPSSGGSASHYVFDSSLWGIKLANRLLKSGVSVSRLCESISLQGREYLPGALVVEGVSATMLETLGSHLGVSLYPAHKQDLGETKRIRLPRTALYRGQGADMQHLVHHGHIAWALSQMEFPYSEITEDVFMTDVLNSVDALIVPAGNAMEIVEGRDPSTIWNRHPWQPLGEPRGIGAEGLASIVQFVTSGGTFVGIGAGGATLAAQEYSGLMNFQIREAAASKGVALLEFMNENHPVLWGYRGSYADDGGWLESVMPTLYYGEKLFGTPAGPMMEVGEGATILATYQRFLPAAAEFDRDDGADDGADYSGLPAIVAQKVGDGTGIVFAVNIGFRGMWTNTFGLLANSLYL